MDHKDLYLVMRYTKALSEIPDTVHPAFFRVAAAIARGDARDEQDRYLKIRFDGSVKKINAIKAHRNFFMSSLQEAKEEIEAGNWASCSRDKIQQARQCAKDAGVPLEIFP